jgi:hypothetical protein
MCGLTLSRRGSRRPPTEHLPAVDLSP